MTEYLFKTKRLGFRTWQDTDIKKMSEIDSDPQTMAYMPSIKTQRETKAFVTRMQHLYNKKGYCYFAVDLLESNHFIGFIGLAEQTYDSDFTPCIDIGWRLDRRYWDRGLGTEGAKKCLSYGIEELNLKEIYAISPKVNQRSIKVIEKIGMVKVKDFIHPQLLNNVRLRDCVLYKAVL